MSVRPFTYLRAQSPTEAVAAHAAAGPEAKYLAGGTTLYDLMKLDVERPAAIIDVTRLEELRTFDTGGRDELVFGALASMSSVAQDPRLIAGYPALAESLTLAASQQLRNMATVGGNLLQRTRCSYFRGGPAFACNKRNPGSGCSAIAGLNRGHAVLGGSSSCIALYPGDWAVALRAFDAVVDVVGPDGGRTIAMDDFHREPGDRPELDNTLDAGELILRIRVPVTAIGRSSTYLKIRDRESYAFAIASAAVAVSLTGDRVSEARVALGGVATRPWRSPEAERVLIGRPLTRENALAAGTAAFSAARPLSGNTYKLELGAQTVADALMTARERV